VRHFEFNRLYARLMEMNTAGAGGSFGDAGSMDQGGGVSNDFYAPGDARTVSNQGTTSRFGKVKSGDSKKKKKKKKKKSATK